MDKEYKKLLENEVTEVIESRIDYINQNYPEIRDIYKQAYDWPEMDTLRHEICICLIFGLHQATITLTNHMLESLLKISLIIHDTKLDADQQTSQTRRNIESFVSLFRPSRKKYGSKDLGDNINRACSVGLITKEQKKELHNIREYIRNPYSHSDKDKAFGDQRIPAQAVRIENDKLIVDEEEHPQLAELIIAHGIAQVFQAEQEAIPYFKYIDNLVRQIKAKLFGINKDNDSESSESREK